MDNTVSRCAGATPILHADSRSDIHAGTDRCAQLPGGVSAGRKPEDRLTSQFFGVMW